MARRKRIEARVNPKVLTWAICTSGWKTIDLAGRLRVEESTFDKWMSGEARPSVGQLELLAEAIRRPMALFFLPEPPKEKPLPKDYRTISSGTGEFDRFTLLAIRKARRLQRITKELLENNKESIEPMAGTFSLDANPQHAGASERDKFGITPEQQRTWSNAYEAFRIIREWMEARNVFVFQMKMPVDDARGFVLADEAPAVIVVNSSDGIAARVFTLVHEYAHVLLRTSGINTPELSYSGDKGDPVEVWCNEFASEFLIPKSVAVEEFAKSKAILLDARTISHLSRKWKVSKSMVLTKMLKTGFVDRAQYDLSMNELRSRGIPEQEGGYGIPVADRVLSEKGRKFVSLVSKNVERGSLNYTEALDYLSVKLGDFDKVTARAEQ